MTESVRDAVTKRIDARFRTRRAAAAAAEMTPQYLGDLLAGRRGVLPETWVRLLDLLGLELVVRPKRRGR